MLVAGYTPDDLISMTEFHILKYPISLKYFTCFYFTGMLLLLVTTSCIG